MKKIAIVGVEGSGKTVMLAGLGNLYSQPDAQGYFLAPKDFSTSRYVADQIALMKTGVWPEATAGDALKGLDWTLRRKGAEQRQRPTDVCEVSFLDFAGEVYRVAFGITEGPAAVRYAGEAEELKRYVRAADDLIVLINLRDVIVRGEADERVREAMWITNGILESALDESGGRRAPRAAIVLSQADSYADTIKRCGGVLGVLRKYLPDVANNYDWLDLLSASAVDRTDLDDDGNAVPAADFTSAGLQPIMDWVLADVGTESQGGRVNPPFPRPGARPPRYPGRPPPCPMPPRPAPAQVGWWANYGLCFTKYAVFAGRASRAEYWRFVVINALVAFLVTVASSGSLTLVYDLIVLLPGWGVTVRRLHDAEFSGWWLLLMLVPFVGWIALLIMLCLPGTPGPNARGPRPA